MAASRYASLCIDPELFAAALLPAVTAFAPSFIGPEGQGWYVACEQQSELEEGANIAVERCCF